ncbi:hypothetical protein K438DRAFT_1833231 [Mycena galopus ATCC 62051]|nr:hypothetical protein K438DRAFT_1833231 [Mycena galopus ATCC 62051]
MLVSVVVHVHLSCTPTLLAHPCSSHPRPAHSSHTHARRTKTRRANPSTHARRTDSRPRPPPLSNTPRRACKNPVRTLVARPRPYRIHAPHTHASSRARKHAPSRTNPAPFRRPALADELLASTPSRLHACASDALSPF